MNLPPFPSQVNQDSEVKASLVAGERDHLLAVAARSRGLVAAGLRGIVYFFDPPDQQSKKK